MLLLTLAAFGFGPGLRHTFCSRLFQRFTFGLRLACCGSFSGGTGFFLGGLRRSLGVNPLGCTPRQFTSRLRLGSACLFQRIHLHLQIAFRLALRFRITGLGDICRMVTVADVFDVGHVLHIPARLGRALGIDCFHRIGGLRRLDRVVCSQTIQRDRQIHGLVELAQALTEFLQHLVGIESVLPAHADIVTRARAVAPIKRQRQRPQRSLESGAPQPETQA